MAASSENAAHTHTYLYDAMKRTNKSDQRVPRHAQHINTDCLARQNSDTNVNISFIVLIRMRKIIKIKYYVRNESTIALLEGKLLNTTESKTNMQT